MPAGFLLALAALGQPDLRVKGRRSELLAHTGDGGIIFPMAGACCLVGGLWFVVTGALWQFVPIGGAVFVAFQVAKALNKSGR